MPSRMPEAKETWFSVAKAPRRFVGETPWMYSGFRLITRPQNKPKISRPMISTSNDAVALLMNIREAPTTDKTFTIRIALRLQGNVLIELFQNSTLILCHCGWAN